MDLTAPHPLIVRIHETIDQHRMFQAGQRVLIGCSGGPDSMALARALMVLRDEMGLFLGLAHLNHGLRGEAADRDQAFVQAFAQSCGLDLALETLDVADLAKKNKQSLEEAGRNARYSFFTRVAREKGYQRIALGHHLDDHVEQVLMNLIRGTGTQGLRGIPPTRGPAIVRPLIQVPKSLILDFLVQLGQPHVADESNDDTRFLRNRVRHGLLPYLTEAFNPDISLTLDRLSQVAAQEDDLLNELTDRAYASACLGESETEALLSLDLLCALHPAIFNRVVRKAIQRVKNDLRRITLGHILDIRQFAESRGPGKSLDLPDQIRIYRKNRALQVKKERIPLRELGQTLKADPWKNR